MAGMKRSGSCGGEKFKRSGHLPGGGTEQVQAPDDIEDPLLAADPLCLGDDFADTGMGAAGDDDQPFPGPAGKCRVIQEVVRFFSSIRHHDLPFPWVSRFKIQISLYFSKIHQIF